MKEFLKGVWVENQIEEKKEQKSRGPGKGAFGFLFSGAFLAAVLAAAGLLFWWAWVSFRMRYSAEFIRVGLICLYIFPCMLGGRLLCLGQHSFLPLWGAVLGCFFYGLLCLCSLLVKGEAYSYDSLEWTTPLLCILSGIAGTIRAHGGRKEKKRCK